MKVRSSHRAVWDIHDSWTELLAGTRFLLDINDEEKTSDITRINLLRLTLVSAYQMTEVMFFRQLIERVESGTPELVRALRFDLNERISFERARRKWPDLVTSRRLALGSEPLQSMQKLGKLRNDAIHYDATTPDREIGESAFYTAIEASRVIYEFFSNKEWDHSQYLGFCEKYAPKSSTLVTSLNLHAGRT